MWSINALLDIHPIVLKNILPTQKSDIQLYYNFIHSKQKPEATRMSFNRWLAAL